MRKLKTWWPEILFFLFTLALGLLTHWGKSNRGSWGVTLYYLDNNLKPLVPKELLNSITLCYLFFWVATMFVYLFSYEVFKSRKWSFLTTIIFYCIPVLIELTYFDVANIPLLTFMIMSFYALVKFVKQPSYSDIILLSILQSLAMITHPIAAMLPIASALFFVLNFLTRNLARKEIWKMAVYVLSMIILFVIIKYGLNYPMFMHHRDYLPSSWVRPWYAKLEWILMIMPPLWIIYFVFSIVALNIVYFSNYFAFLKQKWIYSYLFILLVLFTIAETFMPVNVLMLQERSVYALPSVIILGVVGCYEFSLWVRKRWGEKIYFIFKYSFLSVFALQCVWVIIAMLWLHPEYHKYTNWPLFFMN